MLLLLRGQQWGPREDDIMPASRLATAGSIQSFRGLRQSPRASIGLELGTGSKP